MAKARSEVEDKTKMIDNFHKELSKMQQGEEETPKEGMDGAYLYCILLPGLFKVTRKGEREEATEVPTKGIERGFGGGVRILMISI